MQFFLSHSGESSAANTLPARSMAETVIRIFFIKRILSVLFHQYGQFADAVKSYKNTKNIARWSQHSGQESSSGCHSNGKGKSAESAPSCDEKASGMKLNLPNRRSDALTGIFLVKISSDAYILIYFAAIMI